MLTSHLHRVALALGAVVVWASAAQAQEASYQVEVWAIRALKDVDKIDPQLKHIEKELKRMFPDHKGFRLEKRAAGRVKEGSTFEAKLVSNYSAKVTPKKRKGKRVTLQLTVLQKKGDKQVEKLSTVLELGSGKMNLTGFAKDELAIGVRAR